MICRKQTTPLHIVVNCWFDMWCCKCSDRDNIREIENVRHDERLTLPIFLKRAIGAGICVNDLDENGFTPLNLLLKLVSYIVWILY